MREDLGGGFAGWFCDFAQEDWAFGAGTETLCARMASVHAGMEVLHPGMETLRAGMASAHAGMEVLHAGMATLRSGMETFARASSPRAGMK